MNGKQFIKVFPSNLFPVNAFPYGGYNKFVKVLHVKLSDMFDSLCQTFSPSKFHAIRYRKLFQLLRSYYTCVYMRQLFSANVITGIEIS